jgi:hypothetical protein
VKVLALDLSLAATGVFCGDPHDPSAPYELSEITTPDRRTGEDDLAWSIRRYGIFYVAVLTLLDHQRPDLLVVEVSRTAHHVVTRIRDGHPVRQATSRGHEFRAGAGLGRSEGWLDAVLFQAAVQGIAPGRLAVIEAGLAKLHVAGNQGASKSAVREALQHYFRWETAAWKDSQTDALAAGLGYLRLAEQRGREQILDALVQDAAPKGRSRRPRIVG